MWSFLIKWNWISLLTFREVYNTSIEFECSSMFKTIVEEIKYICEITYQFFSALIFSCKYLELFKEINIWYKLRSNASACCFKLMSSLALLSSCTTTGLEMEKMQKPVQTNFKTGESKISEVHGCASRFWGGHKSGECIVVEGKVFYFCAT